MSILKNCEYCKKEFLARNWKNRPGKFCSQECQRKGRDFKEIKTITFKCECCGKEKTHPMHWKSPNKFCSIQCMAKIRGVNMRGNLHPRWNGGSLTRTPEERKAVLKAKLEIGCCERCGSNKRLHGHHKIPVSERPELGADPKNIEIICAECHAKEHPEYSGMLLREKSGVFLKCHICEKEYYKSKSSAEKSKYCSQKCSLEVTGIDKYRKRK